MFYKKKTKHTRNELSLKILNECEGARAKRSVILSNLYFYWKNEKVCVNVIKMDNNYIHEKNRNKSSKNVQQ